MSYYSKPKLLWFSALVMLLSLFSLYLLVVLFLIYKLGYWDDSYDEIFIIIPIWFGSGVITIILGFFIKCDNCRDHMLLGSKKKSLIPILVRVIFNRSFCCPTCNKSY